MKKLLFILGVTFFSASILAADDVAFFNSYTKSAFYFLAVSLAAFGGTKAQSNATSVALEGMARNPSAADKLFVPMILGLALIESLVIFTLISVFLG